MQHAPTTYTTANKRKTINDYWGGWRVHKSTWSQQLGWLHQSGYVALVCCVYSGYTVSESVCMVGDCLHLISHSVIFGYEENFLRLNLGVPDQTKHTVGDIGLLKDPFLVSEYYIYSIA